MTDRHSPYPADEPIIGGPYPPSVPVPTYPDDGVYIGGDSYEAPEAPAWDDDEELAYDEEYGDYEDGYADYDGEAPHRQPMFYVFIALAALVGGLLVFLLFSLVSRGGDDSPTGGGSVKFNVRIDSPTKDRRIEIGKPEDVIVQATSTEPIVRFDLYIQDKLADTMDVTQASADNKYRAVMKAQFDRKGEYNLYVRVTSSSNATQDSDKVRVIAIEPVGDRPSAINAKVVATVNLRTGPGENFDQVGTLTEGKVVKIIGRTANNEWVLVDVDGGRWVKTTALEPQDSLALVPIRQVTPTPVPATNTPVPQPTASATPSASPTANAKLPDLAPGGATLAEGGSKLRVTIANLSQNAYTGPLEVAVSGVGPGTLSLAFSVNIPASGSTTVEFDLKPPVTSQVTATVKVDPGNAIKEANKDNNTQSFGLTPAVEQPNLVIASVDVGDSIVVRVVNQGGALQSSTVTVKATVAGTGIEKSTTLALAKGQESTFTLNKPGTGPGKVEVFINGQVVASQNITVP